MAEDRYRQSNRKAKRMRERIEEGRKEEAEAEAMNAKDLYKCADCADYYAVEAFEYVHDGETKIARRCAYCRSIRRSNRGNRW